MFYIDITGRQFLFLYTHKNNVSCCFIFNGCDRLIGAVKNLQAAVDALKGLDEKRYTADSWAVFKNALDAAQAVLNKEGASDQEYTDALAALDAAYKGLVEKETPTVPSKPGSGNAGGSGSGSGGAVQTGDAASPAAVLAVLVISGGAVTVLARRRKMR